MVDISTETTTMLLSASKNLAQIVASSSFEFWQRKDFRLFVNFQNIGQEEQDRMFNELEVSVLGLFVLHLEDSLRNAKEEQGIVLKTLQKELPHSFISILSGIGIEQKHLDTWEKLISMRLHEYEGDFKLALKESKKMKEFENDDNLRATWARIETITIDCLTHIRRGNVKKDDPLWKLLRKWLITIDATLNPITSFNK